MRTPDHCHKSLELHNNTMQDVEKHRIYKFREIKILYTVAICQC